jgi:uncharacterized protein YbaP (TraB family)
MKEVLQNFYKKLHYSQVQQIAKPLEIKVSVYRTKPPGSLYMMLLKSLRLKPSGLSLVILRKL